MVRPHWGRNLNVRLCGTLCSKRPPKQSLHVRLKATSVCLPYAWPAHVEPTKLPRDCPARALSRPASAPKNSLTQYSLSHQKTSLPEPSPSVPYTAWLPGSPWTIAAAPVPTACPRPPQKSGSRLKRKALSPLRRSLPPMWSLNRSISARIRRARPAG